MTITKMTVEFDIITSDKEDLLQMSPDLFANMVLNADVPFAQYNDNRFSKYKVFNGETIETRPPFKIFEPRLSKFQDKNMLYLILVGDQGYNMQEYTKNSFIAAAINLEKSTLVFKYLLYYHRSESDILDAVKSLFPTLKFKNRREKNYGAMFNIYYVSIREDSFLDLLLTEPFQEESKKLFSSLLFADEFEKPISEKKKLKLYYDTNIAFDPEVQKREVDLSKIASLGFSLVQYISGVNDAEVSKGRYVITNYEKSVKPEDRIIGTKNTPFKSLFVEPKTPYITVNISKAVNRFVLFQFMNLFSRLLNIYNEVKDQYEKIYDNLIPELKNEKVVEEDLTLIVKPKAKTDQVKKVNLSKIAPEIFTGSYSRDCQFKNQPIIISENQVEYWKNQKITRGNKVYERPIRQIEDNYFVCPNDTYPFIEFKQNLDEERQHPYYPCCYSDPPKEIKERQAGSTYRSKDPIKTNKVMGEEGIAFLPSSIEEMIKGGFEKQVNFFRMGSLISPNSFLACVLIALQDKQYLKLTTIDQKEKYIQKVKKAIANSANFLVTSSELFDLTEEDRITMFLKEDEFLDPSIFYRVVEEVFGLNIFVFASSAPKPNVEPTYSLEISRFSSVPIHSFRKNRPTMIIYKHWGSETDHLNYPQCELVVAGLEQSDATLFTDDVALYLLKGYFISAEVFGKVFYPGNFENYSSLVIYQLIRSNFIGNFLGESENSIQATGQIIDEKGKLAGLQIKTSQGLMTLGVPPLVPQDLPIVKKIQKPKLSQVLKVFKDKPTGFSYENDNAVAVWFKVVSLEYGIQIPIEPESRTTIESKYNLPEVPETRFQLEKKPSQIERLFKLQKDVNIIIQIVRWLFLISISGQQRLTIDEKLEKANEFIEQQIKLNPRKDSDSANVYDFSNLPRKLPSIKESLKNIMKELEENAPTLIEKNQILISGKVFYKRIKESLEHFVRLNLPIAIPQYLDEYYQSIYDYPKIPKNIVFLTKIDFDRWLKQAKENPTSSYPVFFRLRGKLSEMNHPYLYAIEISKPTLNNPFGENFLFLMQNAPFINSLESALENAKRWQDHQINRPDVSSIELEEFKNYKIFTIGMNERFQLIEDKSTNQKSKTLFVLKYPNVDRYASILPL
jgi:hypothetical protein